MQTESAVQLEITLSPYTQETLKELLETDKLDAEQVSRFLEQSVAKQSFNTLLVEIHAQNRDVDPELLQAEVDEAVREVRAEMRQERENGLR